MAGFDILPFLAYYPEIQHPFLVLFLRLVFSRLLFPRVDRVVVAPISRMSIEPRPYDHVGVASYLKECIQFYEGTINVKTTVDRVQARFNTDIEPKWVALEQGLHRLEQFLGHLKSDLVELNLAKRLIGNGKHLLSTRYEHSKLKVELADMPHVINWTSSLLKDRNVLYTQLMIPRNDFSRDKRATLLNEYNATVCNTHKILDELGKRGIYFSAYAGIRIPEYPDLFNIEAMKQLYALFEELNEVHADRIADNFVNSRTMLSSKSFLTEFRTVNGFEFLRLKFIDIPTSYEINSSGLLQFSPWISFHEFEIRRGIIEIDTKVQRMWHSFMGFVERVDKTLLPEVMTLYNNLMSTQGHSQKSPI